MEKRQIGTSGLYTSVIGLGCMSLKHNKQESEYIIHKAIDEGINYFDTADLYDFGKNEELVGNALGKKRADIILATKGGNQWNDSRDSWSWNPSKQYIKEAVKASLKRLKTDYIDLYQLHGGTIEDPIDETIEAFEELIKEGLIRYYGISSIRPNVIRQYVKKSNIVSVMMQYSMLDRRPEEELLQLLKENNISVIARGPLAKGLLTDSFLEKVTSDGYLNYTETELKGVLFTILEWAKKENYQLHELALQYCLANPAVASTIPGASSVEQLISNLNSINTLQLTNNVLIQLQQFLKANRYSAHRN